MKNILLFSLFSIIFWTACKPDRDDEYQLSGTPAAPDFSIERVPGDSNKIIVKDLSSGNFQRIWDFPGGAPKNSSKALDTVQFAKKGEYAITLFVSKSDGSGTASTTKKVVVTSDAPLSCTPKMQMLTACGPDGKCWTFSRETGAVKVGPTYDDYSWYTSPENGLQDAQYDDGFCFTFENLVFENRNNGASVDPWNGYSVKPYDPGKASFIYSLGTGTLNRDQIILPDDQFMGVWDCDNVLDVVKLTDTELIVRGRQRAQNGTPLAQGWFELRFVKQ
ncbi:MAG: PKD domain-containing protein [Saprospiraceae bacterium]|nr:PKD domain-containing protein [Saprospiraceae bacterium]